MEQNQELRDLIPIENKGGKRAVNARMLHAFLENKRKFTDWINQRVSQYGFVENQDFEVFHKFVKTLMEEDHKTSTLSPLKWQRNFQW